MEIDNRKVMLHCNRKKKVTLNHTVYKCVYILTHLYKDLKT